MEEGPQERRKFFPVSKRLPPQVCRGALSLSLYPSIHLTLPLSFSQAHNVWLKEKERNQGYIYCMIIIKDRGEQSITCSRSMKNSASLGIEIAQKEFYV